MRGIITLTGLINSYFNVALFLFEPINPWLRRQAENKRVCIQKNIEE
jgi:hypothetical protein